MVEILDDFERVFDVIVLVSNAYRPVGTPKMALKRCTHEWKSFMHLCSLSLHFWIRVLFERLGQLFWDLLHEFDVSNAIKESSITNNSPSIIIQNNKIR